MSNLLQNNHFEKEYHFVDKDNSMWEKLYTKQVDNLQNKAFQTFLDNLDLLSLPSKRIPALEEVSKRMVKISGWQVVPVDGLLAYEDYFKLLAEKKFPSSTFIRSEQEENLCKDPDIFHEIFGHCTMLLSQDYADFMHQYAHFALTVKEIDRPLFARLIWFTTETGLIRTNEGIKIFGSSIMSSYSETNYCLYSDKPIKKPFNVIDIMREPYRADLLQNVYYVLNETRELFTVLDNTTELYNAVKTARMLGELPAFFPIENNKYTNIGHCVPLNLT